MSSLSAKCAIALFMMNTKTILRNIKSIFPLIASQEIRFYESSGFIIFQMKEEFSFNERSSRKGTDHTKTTIEPTVAYLIKYYSKVTITWRGYLFASKKLGKTDPICAKENRDSMVNELLALHRPVSGSYFFTVIEVNINFFHQHIDK